MQATSWNIQSHTNTLADLMLQPSGRETVVNKHILEEWNQNLSVSSNKDLWNVAA